MPDSRDFEITIPTTEAVDGSYTVYCVIIKCADRPEWSLKKRYTDFLALYANLLPNLFGGNAAAMPAFPQKKHFGAMSAEVVQARRANFETLLQGLAKDPTGTKFRINRVR